MDCASSCKKAKAEGKVSKRGREGRERRGTSRALEVLVTFTAAESKHLTVVSHKHAPMSRVDICRAEVAWPIQRGLDQPLTLLYPTYRVLTLLNTHGWGLGRVSSGFKGAQG